MYQYNKKTIDGIVWVVYKTSEEGTMFHYKDDEHAQEQITTFLKEIGKIEDSNTIILDIENKGEYDPLKLSPHLEIKTSEKI